MNTLDLRDGPWNPDHPGLRGQLFGIRSGAVMREYTVSGVVSADVLSAGDLFRARSSVEAPPLPSISVSFRVVGAAQLVLLDDDTVGALCADPQVAARLVERAVEQAQRLAVARAMGALPRVEQRLLAFFREMAARHGRVGLDGVVLPATFSHAQLGRLVGAQRSTVTLAVTALTHDGRISRRADGRWVLAHDLVQDSDYPTPSDLAELKERFDELRRRFEREGLELSRDRPAAPSVAG